MSKTTQEAPAPVVGLFSLKNVKIGVDLFAKVKFAVSGYESNPIIFKIKYMSKEACRALSEKHTEIEWNRHVKTEKSNDEAFRDEFVKTYLVGWENFTFGMLRNLVPIDVPNADDELCAFDSDNAALVVKHAYELSGFLQEKCMDLKHFRTGDKVAAQGN